MYNIECRATQNIKNERKLSSAIFVLFIFSPAVLRAENTLECPETVMFEKCLCYILQDGKLHRNICPQTY